MEDQDPQVPDPDVDDVDADLEADPSGPPPDSEDDPDAGTPPDGDDEPPEDRDWKNLQEKYPGKSDDEIRAIASAAYWDKTRALSAASKEKRELELRLARLEGRLEGSGPPPDREPPPPPPEVQELDSYITGLSEEDAEAATRQTALLGELGVSRDKAAELKGLIGAAKARGEEDSLPVLEARLELAEQSVKSIQANLFSTVRERKHLKWNKQRAEKEKTWLTRLHSEGEARKASENEELQEALDGIPVRVDGIITATMADKAFGVPADPALRENLRKYVRTNMTVDFWKIGHDVPVNRINIKGLVQQHVKSYLSEHGLAKRAAFAARSRQRTAVSGGTPPPTQRTTPANGPKPPSVVSAHGTLSPGMLRARRVLEKAGW